MFFGSHDYELNRKNTERQNPPAWRSLNILDNISWTRYATTSIKEDSKSVELCEYNDVKICMDLHVK